MTALGDFTAGDVLQASDLNAIGAWSDWTSTITAQTGTPTTTIIYYSRYVKIQDLVIAVIRVRVFDSGTANGSLRFTLPVNANATAPTSFTVSGRETAVTGDTLNGELTTTYANVRYYDNGVPWVNGRYYSLVTIYQAA